MKDDSGVHTHGQLSKEQGHLIPLHAMCLWICMFGNASSLVRGWEHSIWFSSGNFSGNTLKLLLFKPGLFHGMTLHVKSETHL